MKCLECGADIYEGVKKCPYCKTLTQEVKYDEKFKNFDFKYTITSDEQMELIRQSAKTVGGKSGKKETGMKEKLEKVLANRRAAKRAARRAARRGEEPVAPVSVKEETNPFLRNTEVQDMGDDQVDTYTRVNKEEKTKKNERKKAKTKKGKSQFKLPEIDFRKFSFDDKKKNVPRLIFLGGVLVVIILIIWGIIALFGAIFSGDKTASSYAYVKDNSLYLVYNGKSRLASDSVILEDYLQKASVEGAVVSADKIAKEENIIHTIENGKVTYFFEDYDPDMDRGTLCMVKNGDVKKIKNVSDAVHNSVVMTENGEKILYLKATAENGEMGVLHYWKNGMKEPLKITTDIDQGTFEFSKNGEWALFIQNMIREERSGDLYAKDLKNIKAEKQKVDTNVCQLFGSDKDGTAHIYGKEYNTATKAFTVYSVKKGKKPIRLGEETAMAPVLLEKKNTAFIFGDDEDGNPNTNNLYIIDVKSGKKEKVDEGVSDIAFISKDEKVFAYRKVYESTPIVADYYIYTKGKRPEKVASNVVVDPALVENVPQIAVSSDCKTILYISNYEEMKGGGTLNLTKYKNGKATTEKLVENVYSCYVTEKDKFVFNKDYSTGKKMFDIYTLSGKEPKLLKEEVYASMFGVSEKGNTIYYVSDYNIEGAFGNLQRMDLSGKSKQVDSNVAGFSLTEDDAVMVYKNLDMGTLKFDLHLIRSGKNSSNEIDKSISELLVY